MPISSVTNRVSYQCDGTSAVFAFPYRFHAHADLQGFIYNSSLSEPNIIRALELNASGGFGFTVSATADQSNVYPNGGSVVLNSAPNAQCVIVVFRSSAITNGFSISKNGPIPSSGINNAFDYLTMLIQRGQDLLTRSVRLPDGYPRTFDPTLPNTIVANSVLMFNSGATGFAIGPTAYEIANAQSSALSAANSEASANASAVAANSAAVSAGNSAFNANSAAVSIQNAVSLIGSTAFWGAEAQSSALSAFNSQVLANSGALSASNSATLANSAAVSAGAQAVLSGSGALSASNSAASASSSALSASNSMALLYPLGEQHNVLMIHGSSGAGAQWRRPPLPIVSVFNSGAAQTLNISPWVSAIRVRLVGGGGGGGGAANALGGNASGGAGAGYSELIFRPVASSLVYTVGQGGAGGAAAGTNGTTGGSSIVSASSVFMYASGGGGGVGGAVGSTYSSSVGGGAASGGLINTQGGDSFRGMPTLFGEGFGGSGGASAFGGGGSGSNARQNPPGSGVAPGAGGGGGGAAAGGQAGGSGANGIVIVEQYFL